LGGRNIYFARGLFTQIQTEIIPLILQIVGWANFFFHKQGGASIAPLQNYTIFIRPLAKFLKAPLKKGGWGVEIFILQEVYLAILNDL